MFFHAGRGFEYPVRISMIEPAGGVKPMDFDPAHFDYGRNKLDVKKLRNAGYAGFRPIIRR